jgi:chromosome segregation ATPase
MEDTCSGSNWDFTKMASNHGSEACKLILIGLEGVGKTTFVNEACGTSVSTSDGCDGCSVKDDQKGSFTVDGFYRRYELIDMLGVNYKKPGEWQRTLHGRSQVHGVIFYISGANPRDSALGELSRINEYCSNLKIPVLYIYRDGVLRFKPFVRIYTETLENSSQVDDTTKTVNRTKFERYINLDEVKRIIAQTFQFAEIIHELLDPITICGQVQKLREDNQRLNATINTLNQKREKESELHEKELVGQKKKYDEQISRLDQSLKEATKNIQTLKDTFDRVSLKNQEAINKLGNDIQVSVNENQRLQLSLEALRADKVNLEQEYAQLDEDKRNLDFEYHDINQRCDQLQTIQQDLEENIVTLKQQQKALERQRNTLEKRRIYLQKCINDTSDYLESKLESIVSVADTAPGRRNKIKSKEFDGNGKWMWLPGRAYEVIEKYNELAGKVNAVVDTLRNAFRKMDKQETSNLVDGDDDDE